MTTTQRQMQASLFPELAPLAADPPVPAATQFRRAGHKRRLVEAAAHAAPFVEPSIPCRHGHCRLNAGYRALPGRSCAAWCPGCPGHARERGGGTLCLHE